VGSAPGRVEPGHFPDWYQVTHPERIIRLYLLQECHHAKIDEVIQLAKQHQLSIDYVTRDTLDQLTHQHNHQGIAAHCQPMKTYQESDLEHLLQACQPLPFILVLDSVQDPHNLGACFRIADAAGVQMIIAPKDNSVGITPVVSKVACGAAETIPFFQVTNLARTLDVIKEQGVWVYGAAGEAQATIYQTDLTGSVAIVCFSSYR